jgi:hypothetical protein
MLKAKGRWCLFVVSFVFLWYNWGLDSGLLTCKTDVLPLEPHLSPFSSGYFGDGFSYWP